MEVKASELSGLSATAPLLLSSCRKMSGEVIGMWLAGVVVEDKVCSHETLLRVGGFLPSLSEAGEEL